MDKKTALKQARERLGRQIEQMEAGIELLNSIPEHKSILGMRVNPDGHVWIEIPFDWDIFYEIESTLPEGYSRRYSFESNGKWHVSFDNIAISMSPHAEGATCHLEEVGEEVRKVYKVACN